MKTSGKLTALAVKRLDRRGMHNDGNGLYLQIHDGGSKSWVLRYKINGRPRHLGLGPLHTVSLADARLRAIDARRLLLDGVDPIAARAKARVAARLADASTKTFDECAKAYIAAHRSGWRSTRHAKQWPSTLATYASPVFGSLPVASVNTGLIMRTLEPIWSTKTETALRLRGRIESVLDWASANGYREGENPARWKGHLDQLLPNPKKVAKVKHLAALPYTQIAAFMTDLRTQDSTPARALRFLILCAARTGEARFATWNEIDINAKMWTVPGARMKSGQEHRVPLSDDALVLLKDMQATRSGDYVFPGANSKPMPSDAMLETARAIRPDIDLAVHGFRSSFRVWAAEVTSFPSEVAEAALAHAVSDETIASYKRTDFLDRRREMMQSWAAYCSGRAADVVPMRRA